MMPRVDLFTTIHKAVRAVIYDAARSLQSADVDDDAGTRTLDRLEHTLGLLEEHHDHEERSIFPRVRAFEPKLIAELESQHAEVRRLLGVTREALAVTRAAPAEGRMAAGVLEVGQGFHLDQVDVDVLGAGGVRVPGSGCVARRDRAIGQTRGAGEKVEVPVGRRQGDGAAIVVDGDILSVQGGGGGASR